MPVLYLVTAPPPVIEGTDAVFQEVVALCHAFGGKIVNLYPLKRPSRLFSPRLYGLHKLAKIRQLERQHKFNHLFCPVLIPLPLLLLLRNPVIQTVTGSLNGQRKPKSLAALKRLHRIVVSNDRDATILNKWGLSNYAIVPPGINIADFAAETLPLGGELILLMASAPWVKRQFELKGVDALIALAAKSSNLKLIFLWRGSLLDELEERVQRFGIADRVEIINRKVNIKDYLRKAHATVLLAKSGDIVKSYPHSLLESLMAGKPVILSDTIAMADMVRSHNAGIVVDEVNEPSLAAAVETLRRRYDELARNAMMLPRAQFSVASMIDNYRQIYGL